MGPQITLQRRHWASLGWMLGGEDLEWEGGLDDLLGDCGAQDELLANEPWLPRLPLAAQPSLGALVHHGDDDEGGGAEVGAGARREAAEDDEADVQRFAPGPHLGGELQGKQR